MIQNFSLYPLNVFFQVIVTLAQDISIFTLLDAFTYLRHLSSMNQSFHTLSYFLPLLHLPFPLLVDHPFLFPVLHHSTDTSTSSSATDSSSSSSPSSSLPLSNSPSHNDLILSSSSSNTSISSVPPPPSNAHHMITRAKSGIFKTRALLARSSASSIAETHMAIEALTSLKWMLVMEEEYNALIQNGTQELVPWSSNMNLITTKWIFWVKCNMDGSMNLFKERLVACSFQQTTGVDYFNTYSPVLKNTL